MLEEKEHAPWEGRPLGEDGLPVIPLDQAYRDRVAQRIKDWTGEYPLWYTAGPEELTAAARRWVDDFNDQLEREGIEFPDLPAELLRREHLYEDRG